jgi:hypothetical protein
VTCDACAQPYRDGGMSAQLPGRAVRICASCQHLPFGMLWRMLHRSCSAIPNLPSMR